MKLLRPNEEWIASYIAPTKDFPTNRKGQLVFSSHLIADVIAQVIQRTYRYNIDEKKWNHFDGIIWVKLDSIYPIVLAALLQIQHECKKRLDNASTKDDFDRTYTGLDNLKGHRFVYEVIQNLQCIPLLMAHSNQFDTNPDLCNTPDGRYDLLTLDRDPNTPDDLCKYATAIGPLDDDNGANCQNYMNHLKLITQNDQEVIDWIEDISGYILTGHTFTQEFYWFCGIAQSGKSQLTIAWREILGGIADSSYFISAPNTLFAEKYYEPHTEIFMRLAGKRYVLIEDLKGGKWDESKLKEYLSGNPINACKKYGDTVSFLPTGKLIFLSNKQPAIDTTDGGMIRRMNLLEFTKQVPDEAKIPDFGVEVLFKQEGPYILNRMMKAAQRVLLKRKISKPASVQESIKEYIQSNALIELFMQDGCVTGRDCSDTWKNLHAACSIWCNDNGYDPPSLHNFRQTLKDLRYKTGRFGGSRVVLGIALNDAYKRKVNVPVYSQYN